MRATSQGQRSRRAATMVALGVVLAGVGAGEAYAAGGGDTAAPTGATSTVTPADAGAALTPGATATITVMVHNAGNGPVRVASFAPARSTATATCPAGTVTSTAVTAPRGTVAAGGEAAYTLPVRMSGDAANGCQGVTMRLPVTALLVPAA